jgi:hypothetical protein
LNTDNNLQNEGMIFHGRRGQIQLRFGGFDLALVTPSTQVALLDTVGATITSADNDTTFFYYLQTTITLAPGVSIIPEAGIQSNDEIKTGGVATKQSETTYFGAKWQIDF